jgi:hypothetical protein
VYVARDPNNVGGDPNQPGATDVHLIDLSTSADRWLQVLRITGNLGDSAYDRSLKVNYGNTLVIGGNVTKPIEAVALNNVTIGGWFETSVQCNYLGGNFTADDEPPAESYPSIQILVGGYDKTIDCYRLYLVAMAGSLTGTVRTTAGLGSLVIAPYEYDPASNLAGVVEVGGQLGVYQWYDAIYVKGNFTGSVDAGSFLGNVSVGGSLGADALLEIHDDAVGAYMTFGNGILGQIVIHGDLEMYQYLAAVNGMSGSIVIDGSLPANSSIDLLTYAYDRAFTGTLFIGEDLAGTISLPDMFDPDQEVLRGRVIVNGAFKAGALLDIAAITSLDPNDRTEFICIDYDKLSSDTDRWEPNATLEIGNRTWTSWSGTLNHDDPDELWYWNAFETTCCRGDTNNDAYLRFDDCTALLDAIDSFDPNNPYHVDPESPYYLNYPGLAGSMWYHGDVDEDGLVDDDDLDALIEILFNSCPGDCSQQDSRGGEPVFEAAELAAQFKVHIPDSHRERLELSVGTLAVKHSDPDRRAYWKTVYDELQK